MRARFDENKNMKDEVKATQLLNEAEEELAKKMHYQPKQCKLILIKSSCSYKIIHFPFFYNEKSIHYHHGP